MKKNMKNPNSNKAIIKKAPTKKKLLYADAIKGFEGTGDICTIPKFIKLDPGTADHMIAEKIIRKYIGAPETTTITMTYCDEDTIIAPMLLTANYNKKENGFNYCIKLAYEKILEALSKKKGIQMLPCGKTAGNIYGTMSIDKLSYGKKGIASVQDITLAYMLSSDSDSKYTVVKDKHGNPAVTVTISYKNNVVTTNHVVINDNFSEMLPFDTIQALSKYCLDESGTSNPKTLKEIKHDVLTILMSGMIDDAYAIKNTNTDK